MRIHTDRLIPQDFTDAAKRAGEAVRVTVTEHGSRKRARAFNVTLTGTSSRRPNSGNGAGSDDYAATWDEWGIFLDVLFARDAHMTIPRVYESEAHFQWATADRFGDLHPADQHRNHHWVYATSAGTADNSYSVHMCTGCDAERRNGGW